ncbi:MAG: hypothetical protein ACREKM_06145, partial [Longimicrobiales bacterium]
ALPLATVRALPYVQTATVDDDMTTILTASAEDVVRELLMADPSLSGLEVAGAALEDAFLALTDGHDALEPALAGVQS